MVVEVDARVHLPQVLSVVLHRLQVRSVVVRRRGQHSRRHFLTARRDARQTHRNSRPITSRSGR